MGKAISRREFLHFTAGTLSSLAFCNLAYGENIKKRPNILWISCEDISQHLGCFGEKFAITPNIDNFAKEAVRYTRAFTVHGVCAPSRSGIITAMYPSSLGSCNMRCAASKPDSVKCFTEYLRQAGYYCTNNSKEDYNFQTPKAAWDESSKKAHWKNRPAGRPFFAVFNFINTHECKLWNSSDFDNTHPEKLKKSEWQKPENMKVPPIYPDTLAVKRDFARLFERITEFDYFVKEKIDELTKAGLYEDTIIFIWSDHGNGLPRAKRFLYDSGTLSPLIIRVPKKFRIPGQAAPGNADTQLVNFIDLGPTVLNLAGLNVPEYMQGRAFIGPDLSEQRKYIFGARQRIDENYDMVRSVRDKQYRYIRNFMPFIGYFPYLSYAENCNTMKEMRKLHSQGKLNKSIQQWMADSRPPEELYDLQKDPWETNNLAGSPEHQEIKKQLDDVLQQWMVETCDTGLIPEPEMVQLAKELGSEYAIFHQEGSNERIKKILQLAIISTEPKGSDKQTIYDALRDSDFAMRYWAVLALGQFKQCAIGDIARLKIMSTDTSVSVRIASAQSLHLIGHTQEAIKILAKEIRNTSQQEESLHYALNALDLIGPKAKSAIDLVRELHDQRKDCKYIKRISEHFIGKFE